MVAETPRPVDDLASATRRLWSVDGVDQDGGPLELDRLIHERVRLGIVSALAVNGSLTFNDLKGILDLTDGNLSAHARKLEEAGYVLCTKSFDGRTPRTEFTLTPRGQQELDGYLAHMEALIRATRDGGDP
ncbi:MAG: transcriptional regulator [Gemmatimonadota bacterium]|jgi:DNA-binding MarR family transcriptional regulator